jgi:hypothetical protein
VRALVSRLLVSGLVSAYERLLQELATSLLIKRRKTPTFRMLTTWFSWKGTAWQELMRYGER